MRINKKLNIVIPLVTEKHGTVFIHSTPILRNVFELFYSELRHVFNDIFEGNNSKNFILTGPQIAYTSLKQMSINAKTWEGNSGVKFGLVNEIVRLTSVMINSQKGWEQLPFDTIIKREFLDEDEESEVLNALIFFTSISLVAPKQLKEGFLEMAGSTRGWELTSLDSMVFMNGLPTLTMSEATDSKTTA